MLIHVGQKKYRLSAAYVNRFTSIVLNWFACCGRKTLPWQAPQTPYHVLVSEIMLQQTTVDTVLKYYPRFIERFGTIESLAEASEDEVMLLWSGLGYYRRARFLHRSAQLIVKEYGGVWPSDIDGLMSLPGVGRSTAGAVFSLGMKRDAPILDGNVKRVLSRCFAIDADLTQSKSLNEMWVLVDALTPKGYASDYNQAMMDLGALICTKSSPKCTECPLSSLCRVKGTDRIHVYPKKKVSIERKKRDVFFVVVVYRKRVLLVKRTDQDIWSSMWAFPEMNHQSDVDRFVSACDVRHVVTDAPFKHVLSHRDCFIHTVWVYCRAMPKTLMDEYTFFWYNNDRILPGGVPVPVKKIIDKWLEQKKGVV